MAKKLINTTIKFGRGTLLLEAISEHIPSGSNANGSWVKFPDGTMICRRTFPKTPSSYTARTITGGNLVYMPWTFPQPFINDDVQVFTSGDSSGWALDSAGNWNESATGCNVSMASNAAITEVRLQGLAIGRWK